MVERLKFGACVLLIVTGILLLGLSHGTPLLVAGEVQRASDVDPADLVLAPSAPMPAVPSPTPTTPPPAAEAAAPMRASSRTGVSATSAPTERPDFIPASERLATPTPTPVPPTPTASPTPLPTVPRPTASLTAKFVAKSSAGWPNSSAETTALANPVPAPPTTDKWIDVNLSRQIATAYVGSKPVKTVLVSTGTAKHPTVVGTFRIYAKVPTQTMTGGSRTEGDYYSLPNVPNIMYFYRGFGFHGTYWHRNFGQPMSHGCVNLTLEDAKWFYNWASVGTLVVTHT